MIDFHLADVPPQEPLESAFFHEWIFPDGTLWTRFYRTGSGYLLRFPELADFEVSADGQVVSSWPVPGISEETIRHLYLNQVLPLALSRQGKRVFHASAIEAPAGALAFLGESGRGKSTLAASFALAGHRFLADDALLLEPKAGGYAVQPSHPSIRLWDDSRDELVGDDAHLAPAVQYTSKARLLSGEALAFCSEERMLRRMYFLGPGDVDQVSFAPMTPGEAVMGLVGNSFLLDIEGRESLSAHFNQVTEMANLPIVFRLDYPRSFAALPAVRRAILEQAEI
ncbi:MAG: hypothetical protein IPP03_02670 [Dechloromonas sp.]|nr:hypothetical protein [Candidatus Dechloromonas phosphoritropha]MBP8788385.1 hypothetical protein [Azonexus sp.]